MTTFFSATKRGIQTPGGTFFWFNNLTITAVRLLQLRAAMAGAQAQLATLAVAEQKLVAASSGGQLQSGAAAVRLPQLTAALSGTPIQSGTAAVTLQKMLTAIIAAQTQTGVITVAQAKMLTAMVGVMLPAGQIAVATPQLTAALAGGQAQSGTSVVALQQLSSAIAAAEIEQGTSVVALQQLSSAIAATQAQSGVLAAATPKMLTALAGGQQQTGQIAVTTPPLSAALAGGQTQAGAAAVALQKMLTSAAGAQSQSGALAVAAPPMSTALAGVMQPQGILAATMPAPLAAALAGGQAQAGTMSSALQKMATDIEAFYSSLAETGTMATALTQMATALGGGQTQSGALAVSLSKAIAAIAANQVAQVTQVSNAAAAATTVAMPTHATGDLIRVTVWRNGSVTAPTVPSGWTLVKSQTGTTCFLGVYEKLAASSSETTGTWTSATSVEVNVYRGATTGGASAGGTGTGTTITYPALTLFVANSTSWVMRVAGAKAATNITTNTPTGYTARGGVATPTGSALRGCDSNAGLASSPAAGTQTVSGSGVWAAISVEIKQAPTPIANLSDDFNGSTPDSIKWNAGGTGTATQSGGELLLTANTALLSVAYYDLTGAAATFQANAVDANHIFYLTGVTIVPEWAFNSTTQAQAYDSAGNPGGPTITHTPGNWYRIRESGGTLYWDYSLDGTNWTNAYSEAASSEIKNIQPEFANLGTGTAHFGSFNT
jgi:hypothetical protein